MSLVHLSFTQNLIKAPYIIKLCVVRCVSFFFFFSLLHHGAYKKARAFTCFLFSCTCSACSQRKSLDRM